MFNKSINTPNKLKQHQIKISEVRVQSYLRNFIYFILKSLQKIESHSLDIPIPYYIKSNQVFNNPLEGNKFTLLSLGGKIGIISKLDEKGVKLIFFCYYYISQHFKLNDNKVIHFIQSVKNYQLISTFTPENMDIWLDNIDNLMNDWEIFEMDESFDTAKYQTVSRLLQKYYE